MRTSVDCKSSHGYWTTSKLLHIVGKLFAASLQKQQSTSYLGPHPSQLDHGKQPATYEDLLK